MSRLGFSHTSFDQFTKNSKITGEITNSAGNISGRSVHNWKNWRCSTGKGHNHFYSSKCGLSSKGQVMHGTQTSDRIPGFHINLKNHDDKNHDDIPTRAEMTEDYV